MINLQGFNERKVGFSVDENDSDKNDSDNDEMTKKHPIKLHRRYVSCVSLIREENVHCENVLMKIVYCLLFYQKQQQRNVELQRYATSFEKQACTTWWH